jgi:hypothetical protein
MQSLRLRRRRLRDLRRIRRDDHRQHRLEQQGRAGDRDQRPPCNNITFTRNIGFAASTVKGYARGLIIACASNSLFANNTLDGFDISDISVVTSPATSSRARLPGLKIENNILRTARKGVFYFDHLPSNVDDRLQPDLEHSGGSLVYVAGKGSTSSFATFVGSAPDVGRWEMSWGFQ